MLATLSQLQWLNAWALVLLPLPLLLQFIPSGKQQSHTLFLPIQLSTTQSSTTQQHRLVWYAWLSWFLLIVALARPISLGEPLPLTQTGRDMFIAVDISGSMQQEDMPLNGQDVDRLTLVKSVLNDFIEQREGDRLGLILFGTQAFIQTPLTYDLSSFQTLLNDAQIGFAGEKTSIGDAIGLAIKRLKELPSQEKVLILLTDGANTAGSVGPIDASLMASEHGVTIYTIGIGSTQAKRQMGLFNFGSYNPSRDLDVKTLQRIAELTQGEFFRATNQSELQGIYKLINNKERIDQEQRFYRPKTEWFYIPLSLSLLCFLLPILAPAAFNKFRHKAYASAQNNLRRQ